MDDSEGLLFRDVIMLALAAFIMVVVLLLPHINPIAKKDAEAKAPGNMIVEIRWPIEKDADVDIWMLAPENGNPTGFSQKHGLVLDLLRDDLGHKSDITDANFEFIYSRGLPAGEYIINLHLYNAKQAQLPITVNVLVSVRGVKGGIRPLFSRVVLLKYTGEEVTVLRFELDDKGKLVEGSENRVPIGLYPGSAQTGLH